MIGAVSRSVATRAAPLARRQQRRGIVSWMVNYPDKVRVGFSGGGGSAHGDRKYSLAVATFVNVSVRVVGPYRDAFDGGGREGGWACMPYQPSLPLLVLSQNLLVFSMPNCGIMSICILVNH